MAYYGLHPREKGVAERAITPVKCNHCGVVFRAKRTTARWCSRACAQAAFRMRKQAL